MAIKFEPFIHAWRMTRQKKHGAGRGSWQQALKMGLCMFAIAHGMPNKRIARWAAWLALYGTPRIPRRRG